MIIGKDHKSAIGTLVERSTRTTILVHLKNKEAETVRKAFEREFRRLPKVMKKSLTYDNGTEMAQHKLFTKTPKFRSTLRIVIRHGSVLQTKTQTDF